MCCCASIQTQLSIGMLLYLVKMMDMQAVYLISIVLDSLCKMLPIAESDLYHVNLTHATSKDYSPL